MSNLLSVALLSLGALAPLGLVREGEEAEKLPAAWRDATNPDLRERWDRLEGRPAPSLASLSGWLQSEGRRWEDFRGKVVLLDLWATWCGPCIKGIPKLEKLHEKHADDGLVILGVHAGSGAERMRGFVASRKLPWAFAVDAKGDLGAALGVKFIPCYFAIDRNGVMRVAGADRTKLEPIVEALLAEPAGEGNGASAAPTDESDAGGDWPPHVEKDVHAANDLRGKQAPSFRVATWLTSEPSMEDKVVLIDFWATWCGPCRRAIPELAKLQEEFAEDLVVVGVSDEDPETVRTFMAKNRMGYAQAVDPQARMVSEIGVEGIPHVLLIDSTGVVRWQGFPGDERDPLTAAVVRRVVDLDPAVRARRAAEEKKTAAR